MGVSVNRVAFAWGADGHEIAAMLAAPYLSDTTRQQVQMLLGDESLARASTWADRMRSDPSDFWQKEAGPYHYVTIPPGRRYEDIGAPPQGDAITALARFQRDLRAPGKSLDKKRLALRFAIHIVQDLQQPLHVGNGRDRGGNQVSVIVNGQSSNLHSVWDRQIFEGGVSNREAWIERLRSAARRSKVTAEDANPLQWIVESAALRESLYPPPSVIDAAYIARELPKAEARLVLAGIRTAAWLNATFAASQQSSESLEAAKETPGAKSWWRRLLEASFP